MNSVSRVALLLAIALSCGRVWAQDGAGPARILVLADGGVLTGQIVREADDFVVRRSGGQIRIQASRVLLECGSLEEAYEHRRQQFIRPTAESHLALADWCLRYGLLAAARRELAHAQQLDPEHPRLALLTRRLVNAEREPREAAVANVSKNPDPPAEIAQQAPTARGEVPAAVVERFTRKVQPVLVNNCTASGCHSPGGTQPFQLDRALLHGLANRRTTMNNLAATLALVDREQPQLSPLLTVPRRAHGGLDDPVFGPRHAQAFGHLVEWVALVTQRELSSPQTAANAEADTNAVADDSTAETKSEVLPTSFEDDAAAVTPSARQLRFRPQVQRWQPRDPFDPEIFNRQHPAKRRTAVGSAESASGPGDR